MKLRRMMLAGMMVLGICTANMNVYASEIETEGLPIIMIWNQLMYEKGKYESAQEQHDYMQKKLEELTEQLGSDMARYAELNALVSQQANDIRRLEDEIEALDRAMIEPEAIIAYYPDDIRVAYEDLNTMDPNSDDYAELLQTIHGLETELSEARINYPIYIQQYDEKIAEKEALLTTFDQTRTDCISLGKSLPEKELEISEFKQQVETSRQEVESMKRVVDELQMAYESHEDYVSEDNQVKTEMDESAKDEKSDVALKEDTKEATVKNIGKETVSTTQAGTVHTGYDSNVSLFGFTTVLAGIGTILAFFKKKTMNID